MEHVGVGVGVGLGAGSKVGLDAECHLGSGLNFSCGKDSIFPKDVSRSLQGISKGHIM
jgi:hypothetical protein